VRSEGFYVNEKSTATSWDRTSDLPIYSTALGYRGHHSAHVILINFPQQKLLHDGAPMLRYKYNVCLLSVSTLRT
jgi:hypothetical protein